MFVISRPLQRLNVHNGVSLLIDPQTEATQAADGVRSALGKQKTQERNDPSCTSLESCPLPLEAWGLVASLQKIPLSGLQALRKPKTKIYFCSCAAEYVQSQCLFTMRAV